MTDKNQTNDNANDTANANANANDTAKPSMGQRVRDAVKPSRLARVGKTFGKVAGVVGMIGLAGYGAATLYRNHVTVS